MKIFKPQPRVRCAWIVQPGEYVISTWDNQQCHEDQTRYLVHCDHCGNWYCLLFHWGRHLEVIDKEERAKDAKTGYHQSGIDGRE